LVIVITGCASAQIVDASSPAVEEIDDEEYDDSVFFHSDAGKIDTGIRTVDDDKEAEEESIALAPTHIPTTKYIDASIPTVATSLVAYREPEIPIASVSAGSSHSLVLDTFGNVWSSGRGDYGQLGSGTRASSQFLPVRMESDIEAISAGDSHSLLLGSSGLVYVFGDNTYFQLGLEDATERRYEPVIAAFDMQAIEAGFDHSHFIDNEGNLVRVGNQADIEVQIPGQSTGLMGPSLNYVLTSTSEQSLVAPRVIDIASNMDFTMYIQEDLRLWGSGHNEYGQLGDGTTENRHEPVFVMNDVIAVSTGLHHALILRADNSLWSVGRNDHGQLGNGTKVSSSRPIHIMDNIIGIDAGFTHSLALDTQGKLWGFGQMIIDSGPSDAYSDIVEPYPILDTVAAISAGGNVTLAVKLDGSLWVLGENRYGQLGLDSPAFITAFTQVEIQMPELPGLATL
jgi:alpha-tubulin suppressor-like RCC1 family protein